MYSEPPKSCRTLWIREVRTDVPQGTKCLKDKIPLKMTSSVSAEERDFVSLTHNKINLDALITLTQNDGAGAISTFLGTTRNSFEGKTVLLLEYEAYDSMALDAMRALCAKMRAKWNLKHIVIEHKVGPCPVGHVSVFIGVSSAHRTEAIHACEFAINELKATVPIWKKEVYASLASSALNAEAKAGDAAVGLGHNWKANAEFVPQVPLSLLRGAAAQAWKGGLRAISPTPSAAIPTAAHALLSSKSDGGVAVGAEPAVDVVARKRDLVAQRLKEDMRRSACDTAAGEGGGAILVQMDDLWGKDPLIDELGVVVGGGEGEEKSGPSLILCSDVARNEHKLGIPIEAMKPLFAYSMQRFRALREEWLLLMRRRQGGQIGSPSPCTDDVSLSTLCRDLYSVTRAILVVRGDMPTALNMRKELLLHEQGQEQGSAGAAAAVAAELRLLSALLTLHPKSPSAWQHRRWALCFRYQLCAQLQRQGQSSTPTQDMANEAGGGEASVRGDVISNSFLVRNMWAESVDGPAAAEAALVFSAEQARSELSLVDYVNRRYAQNYYGWMHRLWVLQRLRDGGEVEQVRNEQEQEQEYAQQWLLTHTSDHCAANYWLQVVKGQGQRQRLAGCGATASPPGADLAALCRPSGPLLQSAQLITQRPGSEALWCMRRSVLELFLERLRELCGSLSLPLPLDCRVGDSVDAHVPVPAWLSVDGAAEAEAEADGADGAEEGAALAAAVASLCRGLGQEIASASVSCASPALVVLETLLRQELQFVRRCCTDITAWSFQQQRALAIRYGSFCLFAVKRILESFFDGAGESKRVPSTAGSWDAGGGVASDGSHAAAAAAAAVLSSQLAASLGGACRRLLQEDAFERGWGYLGRLPKP